MFNFKKKKRDEEKNKENNNMTSSVKVLSGNLRLDFKAFQTAKINPLITYAFEKKQEICVIFCACFLISLLDPRSRQIKHLSKIPKFVLKFHRTIHGIPLHFNKANQSILILHTPKPTRIQYILQRLKLSNSATSQKSLIPTNLPLKSKNHSKPEIQNEQKTSTLSNHQNKANSEEKPSNSKTDDSKHKIDNIENLLEVKLSCLTNLSEECEFKIEELIRKRKLLKLQVHELDKNNNVLLVWIQYYRFLFKQVNLNYLFVRNGFAEVGRFGIADNKSEQMENHYQKLLKYQKYAKIKGFGIWKQFYSSFIQDRYSFSKRFASFREEIYHSFLTRFRSL